MLGETLERSAVGRALCAGCGYIVASCPFVDRAGDGLVGGGITAFCGPIAFVGVAVPFIARGLFQTSNHRVTMLSSALIGANLLLICDIISNLFTYPLPISTVSALFGAPVVVWIVLRGR